MQQYTIHPLTVGANETDQGIMTYLQQYGKRIWIPIYVFYLNGGDKNILIDTGLEQFVVPPEVSLEFGFEILEFEDALARVNLKPEDIDIIIHTHLHNDHCENDYKCSNAKLYVQEAEYEFFKNPHPLDHRYYPDILDDVNLEIVKGDTEILDGVRVIFSPGHTPGGQSVAVNTSAGEAIITGFCCNGENFPAKGRIIAPGVHTDAIAAYDSCLRIQQEAEILVPLHDVAVGRHNIPE